MSDETTTGPISYSIDQTRGVIFETWRGDVTAGDLRRYWQEILTNPEVLARRRTLVDLRLAKIKFNGEELSNLVSSLVIPILNGRGWKTAIVVEHPVQFGVSMQYHVFASSYSADHIFHDYNKALDWLLPRGGKIIDQMSRDDIR